MRDSERVFENPARDEEAEPPPAVLRFAELCPRLQAAGIQEVRVHYDGYGDEGAIEGVEASGPGGEIVDLDQALEQELIEGAWDLLPDSWDMNEGSFGTLVVDVRERQLKLTHQWQATTSDQEEQVWTLPEN